LTAPLANLGPEPLPIAAEFTDATHCKVTFDRAIESIDSADVTAWSGFHDLHAWTPSHVATLSDTEVEVTGADGAPSGHIDAIVFQPPPYQIVSLLGQANLGFSWAMP
jgi:hypothetical protein